MLLAALVLFRMEKKSRSPKEQIKQSAKLSGRQNAMLPAIRASMAYEPNSAQAGSC
jgi:hypothetical protein